MKIKHIVTASIVAMTITGCFNSNNTNNTNGQTSAMCESLRATGLAVGVNVDTYSNDGTFDSLMSLCDFNRLYRGSPLAVNDTNNRYFSSAYIDTPADAKNNKGSYDYYSYVNLVSAYNLVFSQDINKQYKPFSRNDYFDDMRELSAFLANIGQETSGNSPAAFTNGNLTGAGALGNGYGLFAVREQGCDDGSCSQYGTKYSFCEKEPQKQSDGTTIMVDGYYRANCLDTTYSWSAGNKPYCKLAAGFCDGNYPADANTNASYQYFGRGGKQLSYPYNYMYYGAKIYPNDPYKIANNPSLLDSNGTLGWATALAYWAIPSEELWSTKPSMHQGFFEATGNKTSAYETAVGFGKTVNIINGGVECGANMPYVRFQTLNRINSYLELLFLNFGQIPVDRVEVTRDVNGQTVVDTYTREQLLHNISTEGVTIKGYNYVVNASSADAPHKVKQFTRNGVAMTTNYGSLANAGRFNSQPLIQEYYNPAKTVAGTSTSDITKIILYYDKSSAYNKSGLASERLDCSGVPVFGQ